MCSIQNLQFPHPRMRKKKGNKRGAHHHLAQDRRKGCADRAFPATLCFDWWRELKKAAKSSSFFVGNQPTRTTNSYHGPKGFETPVTLLSWSKGASRGHWKQPVICRLYTSFKVIETSINQWYTRCTFYFCCAIWHWDMFWNLKLSAHRFA